MRQKLYTLDADGNPVATRSLFEWAMWFETADRKVALTKVGNVEVSTVFLGVDHRHGRRKGRPIVFETLVFIVYGQRDRTRRGMGARYATRAAALAGHDQVVAELRAERRAERRRRKGSGND